MKRTFLNHKTRYGTKRTTAAPVLLALLALAATASPAVGQQTVIAHDAWLNVDFINKTGQVVNDFEVVVASPTFNPPQWFAAPFNVMAVTNGATSTTIRFSGTNIQPDTNGVPGDEGDLAHVGMLMKDSGRILNAYWTLDGNPVPVVPNGPTSIAISYEITEVRTGSDPAIHFKLWMPSQYYADRPSGAEAGWTGIRTFRNIPASLLDLADLNRDLFTNFPGLDAYEVDPYYGIAGYPGKGAAPIALTDENLMTGPDSFFDVYVDTVMPEYAGPEYESLLVATVLNQGQPIGMFWNLNPQCPEPATLLLLVLGGLAMMRRRK